MAYLHCKFKYNLAHVVYFYDDVQPQEDGVDFVTGDVTVGSRYFYEHYDYGTANGTTLTTALAVDDNVLQVADTTGMVADERVSVLLDNGLRHVTFIESVDSGLQITITDGVPSAAAISNNVVSLGQLEGTTDGTLEEDFKDPKATEILNQTDSLLDNGFHYAGHIFPIVNNTNPHVRINLLANRVMFDRVSANLTITNITQDAECVVETSGINDVKTFDLVFISGVVGMTEVNNGIYYVGPITGDNFELWEYPSAQHVDSSGFTAYTSGGTVTKQEGCQYQGVLDIDGHPYQFTGNDNFLHYYQAFSGTQNDILGNVGGQTDLILQVAEADNTQAAMDLIVDART